MSQTFAHPTFPTFTVPTSTSGQSDTAMPALTCTDIELFRPTPTDVALFRTGTTELALFDPSSVFVPSPAALAPLVIEVFDGDGDVSLRVVGTVEALRDAGGPGMGTGLDDYARTSPGIVLEAHVSATELAMIVAGQCRAGNADVSVALLAEVFDIVSDTVQEGFFWPRWDDDGNGWVADAVFPPSVERRLVSAVSQLLEAADTEPVSRERVRGLCRYILAAADDQADALVRRWGLVSPPGPGVAPQLWMQFLCEFTGGDAVVYALTPPATPSDAWVAELRVQCSHHDALVDVVSARTGDSDHDWAHWQMVWAAADTITEAAPVSWAPVRGPVRLRTCELEQFVANIDSWRAAGVDVVSPSVALRSPM